MNSIAPLLKTLVACVAISALTDLGLAESLRMSWKDNSSNELGFHIYRSSDGKKFKRIGSTTKNKSSYVDHAAKAGVKYWYRVTAYNKFGESGYSNVKQVRLALPAPSKPKAKVAKTSSSNGSKAGKSSTSSKNGYAKSSSYSASNIYYSGVVVSNSGSVPLVMRAAPRSTTSASTMSAWKMGKGTKRIGSSKTWSREKRRKSIDYVIRTARLYPPVRGISEPALFLNATRGEVVTIFDRLSKSSGIRMFEIIDARSYVFRGARIKEIYSVGPFGSKGNGFSVRFRVNEPKGVLYDIVGMIPDVNDMKKGQLRGRPKIVLYSEGGRILKTGGVGSAAKSGIAKRASLAPLGKTDASTLSVKLRPGIYTVHVFSTRKVDAKTLAGLSIRRR